ncbi:hypothetical protein AB0O90_17275 [Microbacterium testaceum]|uniref:hypothetical protein n=1 Tax=Microbacterium testaceum TaxID=2033 RepID=UPI003423BDDA
MRIPEPLRLWWHDGAGVRVLRYSSRQWAVLAGVSLLCAVASFLPVETMPARALLAVVPYMLIPAGVATGAFALVAAVRTHRFRRDRRL